MTTAPAERRQLPRIRAKLRQLYFGERTEAFKFRLAVLAVDVAIIAFFVAAPFLKPHLTAFYVIDYLIATLLALDLGARAWASGDVRRWVRSPIVIVDLFVFATLLFPAFFYNFGFLRVLRLWTLVHSDIFWKAMSRGRYDETRVEDITKASVTLVVFVFIVTGFVYTSFARVHPGIDSYLDALYFTVATLTTTGFGDITLPGAWGRWISIVTMLVGITLFVRLGQSILRPAKVVFPCPSCGLIRHDLDAVHCKACGHKLAIPNDSD